MLKAGIVGLPNVGKSTLFNALTRGHSASAENYPFCTIEPNLGVVAVPDERLEPLARIAKSAATVPTTIEFVDIAGLVKGASRGEGLGNKFLSHIREVDAIIQVVRCFEDNDIHHVTGSVDAVNDIETVMTELVLADLDSVQRRLERVNKDAKRGDPHAQAEAGLLQRLEPHLDSGRPALMLELSPEEKSLVAGLFLLTSKPTVLAANVKEAELAAALAGGHPQVTRVREYARTHHACDTVLISAQLESDLMALTPEEAEEYLAELGVKESGVAQLIQRVYRLLGLRTFLTANDKEARAWTIRAGETAPRAAGVIHTDFERGFIKAETVAFEDLVRCGSVAAAREQGLYRMEGKDYEVQEGDVIQFRFNV